MYLPFGDSLWVRSERSKNADSLARVGSRPTLERSTFPTMSSCLSTAAPPSDADPLNSSCGRRNGRENVLPYEILSKIFSYISHGHILHLRHLPFVCRSWSFVI